MSAFKSYKEKSREVNWGTSAEKLTEGQIQLGAVLRIADASELMAQNHAYLIQERDYQRRRAERAEKENERLRRSNAALRGHLGRLKRRDQ